MLLRAGMGTCLHGQLSSNVRPLVLPPKTRLVLIRTIYFCIAAAAISIVTIAMYSGAIGSKDVATAILALLGTFLGATFAFRLNQEKEDKKLHTARRESLNRAMFILARQVNAITVLKRDYDKFANPFERAFHLPALKPPSYSDLIHNFTDLEFLLELEDPNLLLRLTVEQERFHQAIDSVKTRNEFYVGEFQSKLAETGLNGVVVTPDEAAKRLGERIFGGVLNGTEIAYAHISASERSIPEIQAELLRAAKRLYPESKFIAYAKAA